MKKKILSLILAATLCFGASLTAFATESGTENGQSGSGNNPATVTHEYDAYQIFTGKLDSTGKMKEAEYGSAVYDSTTQTYNQAVINALIPYANDKVKEYHDKLSDHTKDVPAFVKDTVPNAQDLAEFLQYTDYSTEAVAITADVAAAVKATDAIHFVGSSLAVTEEVGYYLVVDVTDFSKLGDKAEVYRDNSQLRFVKDGTLQVEAKRDKIEVHKEVMDINDSTKLTVKGTYGESADYDLGDLVPFRIYTVFPSDLSKYTKYEYLFHDVQSAGLDFQKDTVEVVIEDKNHTKLATLSEADKDYTVSKNGVDTMADSKDSFEVAMDLVNVAKKVPTGTDLKDTYITVYYKSILTKDALKNAVIVEENKVCVEYSNDKGGKGRTPFDIVFVFSLRADVNKIDKYNNPLKGAEFTLYKLVEDTAVADPSNWAVAKRDDGTTDYIIEVKNPDGSETKFSFGGIDDGYYKLVESKVPDEYNKMDDIYFKLEVSHTGGDQPKVTGITVYIYDAASKTFKEQTGANLGTFTVKLAESKISADIVNQKGAILPSTGGIGTTIFYVVGGVLVAAAVVLLVVRRRMRVEEE